MDKRILLLTFGNFTIGTGMYVFLGVLEPMARSLGVSVGTAGQVATVFALTYAVGAPLLIGFTGSVGRRALLSASLGLFALSNVGAALAQSFSLLVGARVVGAVAASAYAPVAGAVAASLAAPAKKGQALAAVTGGIVVAFVVGIPLGTFIGGAFGWRATFWLAAVLAGGGLLMVQGGLPRLEATPRQGGGTARPLRVMLRPEVAANLAVVFLAFAAVFVCIGYVGPLLKAITGFGESGVGTMQVLLGIGGLVGTVLGGVLADRNASARTVALILTVIALGGLLPCSLLVAYAAEGSLLAIGGAGSTLFVGATALFCLSPVMQYRLVQAAPRSEDTVLALNYSGLFFGQGVGVALGGAVLSAGSLLHLGYTGALVAVAGLLFLLVARRTRRHPAPR